MISLQDHINGSNYRLWGFNAPEGTTDWCDNGAGVLFGAPPLVPPSPDVFQATSKGSCCFPSWCCPNEATRSRIVHVSGDNLGYPGWIIAGFIEAVSTVLDLGRDIKYPAGWERYLFKIHYIKTVLSDKNLPLFSITPDIIRETTDILDYILKLDEPKYSLQDVETVHIIGAGIVGTICALLIKKLYRLDKIIVFEKQGNIGGRLLANFSGAMRFPKDLCVVSLLRFLEDQGMGVKSFDFEPVTHNTLLYNPDSDDKFEWFLKSDTYEQYNKVSEQILDNFHKFKENFGILEGSDFETINKRYCAIFEGEEFQNWTFEQYLRADSNDFPYTILGAKKIYDYNGISEEDFELFSHLGFYTGSGQCFSEKRFSSQVYHLEDGRLTVPHIGMPNFLEVMLEYLLSNGVIFKFNSHVESPIEAPRGGLVIDARQRRYVFDSPHEQNQERWELFSAAKLFFNIKDVNEKMGSADLSYLWESGVDRIIGLNTNWCKENIYIKNGWIVSYCWLPWYASSFIKQLRRLNETPTTSTSQLLKEVSEAMEKYGSEFGDREYRTVQSDKLLQPKMMLENLEEVLTDMLAFLKKQVPQVSDVGDDVAEMKNYYTEGLSL